MTEPEEKDFYMEGPYMVFTESFLRRRGYCCESGCRHCPWGYRNDRRNEPMDFEQRDRDPENQE
jgi:hypothetical protein